MKNQSCMQAFSRANQLRLTSLFLPLKVASYCYVSLLFTTKDLCSSYDVLSESFAVQKARQCLAMSYDGLSILRRFTNSLLLVLSITTFTSLWVLTASRKCITVHLLAGPENQAYNQSLQPCCTNLSRSSIFECFQVLIPCASCRQRQLLKRFSLMPNFSQIIL